MQGLVESQILKFFIVKSTSFGFSFLKALKLFSPRDLFQKGEGMEFLFSFRREHSLHLLFFCALHACFLY